MSTTLDATTNAGWNPTLQPPVQDTASNDLPPELAAEAVANYNDINIRPYFAHLALEKEKLQKGQILKKTEEMRALRDNIRNITNFLDKAQHKLMNHNGKPTAEVGLEAATEIENLRPLLSKSPEMMKLLDKGAKITQRELELVCKIVTRKIDNDLAPKIEDLQDDITDIREHLNLILPILKELLKKYDDHISNIIRLPKA